VKRRRANTNSAKSYGSANQFSPPVNFQICLFPRLR